LRDRDLVRLYWPAELRPAFDALFGIDDAMADVVARSTQPALGAIKLAWWRERLEELDQGKVPAEPRLKAAATELLPRGISGRQLSALEEGWAKLLEGDGPESFILAAGARGPLLLTLAAKLVDPASDYDFSSAGREFAFVDLARRGIVDIAAQRFYKIGHRYPRRIRPVTALWALARRDQRLGGPPFEAEATPRRAWTLLRHRLTGR
jgi:phytoene synthase